MMCLWKELILQSSLGVMIDENLKWKNHIDAISKTSSRNTCIVMLGKMNHYVPGYILGDSPVSV